jgi:hypothetical protein
VWMWEIKVPCRSFPALFPSVSSFEDNCANANLLYCWWIPLLIYVSS